MRVEWNEEKNRRNRAKHKVGFEVAQLVFDDPHARTIRDRIVNGEERWQTVGLVRRTTGGFALFLVAHTSKEEGGEEVIRIISLRKATPRERRIYEEGDKI